MDADYAEQIGASLETMAGRKGLDWIIDRGIRAMEAEHRQQVARLIGIVHDMGMAVDRGQVEVAREIYAEFTAD